MEEECELKKELPNRVGYSRKGRNTKVLGSEDMPIEDKIRRIVCNELYIIYLMMMTKKMSSRMIYILLLLVFLQTNELGQP